MTEHEKFKWINDTIGYELPGYIRYCEYYDEVWFWKPFHCNNMIYSIKVDVREIIYTTKFQKKFIDYRGSRMKDWECARNNWIHMCLIQLDDPVSYLYNLLGWHTNN